MRPCSDNLGGAPATVRAADVSPSVLTLDKEKRPSNASERSRALTAFETGKHYQFGLKVSRAIRECQAAGELSTHEGLFTKHLEDPWGALAPSRPRLASDARLNLLTRPKLTASLSAERSSGRPLPKRCPVLYSCLLPARREKLRVAGPGRRTVRGMPLI